MKRLFANLKRPNFIKDIATHVENQSIPNNIPFFVKGRSMELTGDIKEGLTKQILGEEAYLKKQTLQAGGRILQSKQTF